MPAPRRQPSRSSFCAPEEAALLSGPSVWGGRWEEGRQGLGSSRDCAKDPQGAQIRARLSAQRRDRRFGRVPPDPTSSPARRSRSLSTGCANNPTTSPSAAGTRGFTGCHRDQYCPRRLQLLHPSRRTSAGSKQAGASNDWPRPPRFLWLRERQGTRGGAVSKRRSTVCRKRLVVLPCRRCNHTAACGGALRAPDASIGTGS